MKFDRSKILRVCVVLLASTLCQCGQKSRSQNVDIVVTPSQPIVFTANLPLNQNGTVTTVTAPWFRFQVAIRNNDPSTALTIIHMHVEVTGVDASGSPVTNTVDFDPTTDDFTTTDVSCNFSDYGTFNPGGGATATPLYETGTGVGCTQTSGTSTTALLLSPVFYAGGNPTTGPSQTSFSYQVMVKPEGWFGTTTNQVDRFDGQAYVTAH